MYEEFFGFREKPFEISPDPDYLYLSAIHRKVRDHLAYAVQEGKGFAVITGAVGSGKTTMLRALLRRLPRSMRTAVVTNTAIPAEQLLKLICRDLEIGYEGDDPVERFEAFNQFLVDEHSIGNRTLLLIDEAQNLSMRAIEELRLLSNLDSGKYPLLQIILIGQPELRGKLRDPKLSQFVQRVTVHCHLEALPANEVPAYVRHRLKVAGGSDPELFDQAALDALARYSKGVPRLINLICDTALVFAFGDETNKIGIQLIEEVIEARRSGGLFLTEETSEIEFSSGHRPEDNVEDISKRLKTLESTSSTLKSAVAFILRDMRRSAKQDNGLGETAESTLDARE